MQGRIVLSKVVVPVAHVPALAHVVVGHALGVCCYTWLPHAVVVGRGCRLGVALVGFPVGAVARIVVSVVVVAVVGGIISSVVSPPVVHATSAGDDVLWGVGGGGR